MLIQIKTRFTQKGLFETDAENFRDAVEKAVKSGANLYGADLYGKNLSGANLSGANLSEANLYGADLYGADLYGADLSGADLSEANLSGANLYGADLSGARGVNSYRVTPILILREQPGKIRAYKLVNNRNKGPYNGGIIYRAGGTYEVSGANTDESVVCAAGINVATLDWCMREWVPGYKILVVEFTAIDIAAIPPGTDGKFRLFRCTVVGEKDLVEIGLVPKQ